MKLEMDHNEENEQLELEINVIYNYITFNLDKLTCVISNNKQCS